MCQIIKIYRVSMWKNKIKKNKKNRLGGNNYILLYGCCCRCKNMYDLKFHRSIMGTFSIKSRHMKVKYYIYIYIYIYVCMYVCI